jgi:hypothetical protein
MRTEENKRPDLGELAAKEFIDLTDAENELLRAASRGETAYCGPSGRGPSDQENDPIQASAHAASAPSGVRTSTESLSIVLKSSGPRVCFARTRPAGLHGIRSRSTSAVRENQPTMRWLNRSTDGFDDGIRLPRLCSKQWRNNARGVGGCQRNAVRNLICRRFGIESSARDLNDHKLFDNGLAFKRT